MFEKWLANHDISQINFDGKLFPTAADRVFWSGCMGQTEIREAEKYIGYDWPMLRASHFLKFHKEGDRLAYENPYFARRTALVRLLLGELSEYQGRFLPELCDGVLLVCEETYWGLSAHTWGRQLPPVDDPLIDLFAAETAEFMAVLRYLFADALGEYCLALLERIDYELERRILKPYLAHTDFVWMGYHGRRVNNWNPWILSNILTVFLLQVKDRAILDTGIRKMCKELDFYYLHMPDDGGCDEGPNYWDVAGGRVFVFCDRLYVFSGGEVDLFGDRKLQNILSFPIHAHISGCRFANFADGSSCIMDDNDYIFYINGLRIAQPRLCALASTMKAAQAQKGPVHLRRIGALCAELYGRIYSREIENYPQLPSHQTGFLPDTQLAFFHREDWYFAAKGGFNAESHNHNDVGNFMVYHKGAPVLIDPGCGVYRKETFQPALRYQIWTMQSCWHCLPTINGCDQLFGQEYRADHFQAEENGVVVSFSGAYPPESGAATITRKLCKEEDRLLLTDNFVFDHEKNTVTENFMTPLLPEVGERGVLLGGKYLLSCDMPCEIQIDKQEIREDPKLYGDWNTDTLYRIRMTVSCGKTWTGTVTLKEV